MNTDKLALSSEDSRIGGAHIIFRLAGCELTG